MSGSAAVSPVYAIVVNYNGWRDTIECLESLLRSDYPALHVMVCDNGSSDDSVDRIRAWARGNEPAPTTGGGNRAIAGVPPISKPVKLAGCTKAEIERNAGADFAGAKVVLVSNGSNLGFAGANNVGLRYVRSREPDAYAFLLNNDAVTAPGALSAMVQHAARNPGTGVVGATILQYRQPDRVETLGGARLSRVHGMVKWIGANAHRDAPRPATLPLDYVSGCCMLVPRSTIERVGLMDERYFLYGEDTDWCLRMRERGLSLEYCPSAEVWHKGGGSVVHGSAQHDYYAVRGMLMVVHHHFPMTLPGALTHAALRFMLPKLARGEWQRLRAAARGYRDFVLHAVHWTKEQPA